jgi:hypothetical protein
MPAVRQYRRIALDCLDLSETTCDPGVREQMVRLAQLWARLALRVFIQSAEALDHHRHTLVRNRAAEQR